MPTKEHPTLPLVILAMPRGERRRALQDYLAGLEVTVELADSCQTIREYLKAKPEIDVIITHASLRDGNWCDVLNSVVSRGVETRVVVNSTFADERFWSEALWRGVYDLLVEPYDRSEVTRIVNGALRAADHLGFLAAPNSPATTATPEAASDRLASVAGTA